ncbi:hypothetical protein RX533_000206 [Proteus mirabilis]|uniref:Uncharacterized protein n=10 Tax=Proteus mirabilis TaxID=584 RepID=A0A7D5W235_PROMI|nr:hypothetical protein [Proteus mirabilis]EJD6350768.1 hypothetical protein [Proteus mirabilis]EJD6359544.1 hypothetical protein [Proteus mirabilis]EJD6627039.1 hypothetical protein [Proteus mirabilis]EKU6854900.1 hypothetical protein [Proteus mirabilis]EKV4200462.1 hypothetical protein [Proteus mirabilis]
MNWLEDINLSLFVAFLSLLFTVFIGFIAIFYAKKTYDNAEKVYQFQLKLLKREVIARDIKLSLVNSYLLSQISWYEQYFDENIKCLIAVRDKILSGYDSFYINDLGLFHTISFGDGQYVLYKNIEFKASNIFELINIYAHKNISVPDNINGLIECSSRIKGFFDLIPHLIHRHISESSVNIDNIITSINGVVGELNSINKKYIDNIKIELNKNT